MNERIQELMEQAMELVDPYAVEGEFGPRQLNEEKFAELIVQECLGDFKERIATRYQGSDQDRDIAYGMEIVYFSIIDKFGVDE
jgi:hypothetical protein